MISLASLDKSDMRSKIKDFSNQITQGYNLAKYVFVKSSPDCIVIAGMGGSGIAGKIMKEYLENSDFRTAFKIPVHIVSGYDVPRYVTEKTLVFAVSYSGETEETLNVFKEAQKIGAEIVGITSGGRLASACAEHKVDVVQVPSGIPPRAALAYLFFSMLRVLENSKIIASQKEEVAQAVTVAASPVLEQRGKELAALLKDKIPLIYASERLVSVAYRWKTQINENAKAMAFSHVFPELDHNEINAFQNLTAKYHIIMLKEKSDSNRIQARMDMSKKLIQKQKIDVSEIALTNFSYLANIFTAIILGDYASYYLALNYSTDPTPVDVVTQLKKELKK